MTRGISAANQLTPRQKVDRALTELVEIQPYWGYLGAGVEIIEDPKCKTAWTDGVRLGYNPNYVATRTVSQTRTLLAHEIDHCADGHPWRRGTREPKKWNRACDLSTNPKLLDAGMEPFDEHWVYEPQYAGQAPEWIFARLVDKEEEEADNEPPPPKPEPGEDEEDEQQPDQPESQDDDQEEEDDEGEQDGAGDGDEDDEESDSDQPGGPGEGEDDEDTEGTGGGGEGDGSEEDEDQPYEPGEIRDPPPDAVDQGATQEKWQQMSMAAANAASQAGNLPGSIAERIDKLKHPKGDWIAMLYRFFDENAADDYSWEFPDVDFIQMGLYLPEFNSPRMGPIVIGWDTSQSTSREQKLFGDEVGGIINNVKPEMVYVMYADYIVQRVDEFDPSQEAVEFNPTGFGGTSFVPVFEEVEKRNIKPALLIYFTDLEGDFPRQPDYPVLWVSVKDHQPPWGETAYMLDGGIR